MPNTFNQPELSDITVSNQGVIQTVVLTARSFFLNRFLKVSVQEDEKVGGDFIHDWKTDTLIGTLGLTSAVVQGWAGKKVLDVGCGGSFLAAEGYYLDRINVDRADLHFNKTHVTSHKKPLVKDIYVENMEFFHEHYVKKKALTQEDYTLFRRLYKKRHDIARNYFRTVGNTKTGIDATNMATIRDDTYDVAVSVYVLAYLNPLQQEQAVREMIRVTKAGGQLRIFSGATPLPFGEASFRRIFEDDRRVQPTERKPKKNPRGEFAIHTKVASVNAAESRSDLLVIDLVPFNPYNTNFLWSMTGLDAMQGKQCVRCRAVHTQLPSVMNRWHRCRNCKIYYCPSCGSNLPKIGNLFQARTSFQERRCVQAACTGQTELV